MATNKIAIDVEVKSEGGARSLKDLKGQLKELQNQISETKEGSKEYYEVLKKIGATKDDIEDLNEAISATTGAGKFQAIANMGSQIANGFQLAQGAMALFGTESEGVAKALQKAQAAMAFAQGIKELEGFSDAWKNAKSVVTSFGQSAAAALKGMKAGIAATGIGVLLIAVGALVAYWDDIKGFFNTLNETLENYRNEVERTAQAEKKANEERINAMANMAKLKQMYEEQADVFKKRNELLEKTYNREIALARAAGKDTLEIEREKLVEIQKNLKKELELREKAFIYQVQLNQLTEQMLNKSLGEMFAKGAVDDIKAQQKAQLDLILQMRKQVEENDLAIEVKEVEHQKKMSDIAKEAKEKKENDRKAEEEKIKSDLERNRNEELQNLENQRKAKELDGTLTYEDRKKYLDDVYALEIQKSGLMAEDLEALRLKHLENLKNLDAEQKEINDEKAAKDLEGIKKDQADQLSEYETRIKTQQRLGEDSTALELEAAKYKLDTILNDENASYEQRIAAQEEYQAKVKELDDKAAAEKQAIEDAKVQLTYDSLKLIGDIATNFAKDDEASQRKAFEINKKVQLAMATIDMIRGVQGAFKSAMDSPLTGVFPAFPYVQAAMAAAYGIMNIRKISQTQFQGGGGADAGMSGAAGGAGGAMSAPLQGGVNNTSTMLENMGQGQQEQKPIKAYVLQTDVASEDQKIKAIENKSKIE